MPRGNLLSDYEKAQIVAMKRECVSIREIARTLDRYPGAAHNFLRHAGRVDGLKCTRNAMKIKETQTRLLLWEASKGEKSWR